jgi:hypothetical protein
MMDDNRHSDEELVAEFERLFPHGFAGPDVLEELAPQGWEHSPLVATFHPSAEQLFREASRMHRNLLALRRKDDTRPAPAEPTLDEFVGRGPPAPIETDREVRELVGQCLWDVFSDNHEVVAADGRVLDLGSFRASGGFLADVLNTQTQSNEYDYLSFYLGTLWLSDRADLTPVYRMIFHRLRARGHDWFYQFPRVYLVDMRPLKAALDAEGPSATHAYDPSEAFARELAERERDEEIAAMQERLDETHAEAVEQAVDKPPPPTVCAYRDVYGVFPRGWPPTG